MVRSTNILIVLVLAYGTLALGQDLQAGSQVPEDALTTRQLIAWSGLQKPQPVPQPLPPRDTPIPQPDQPSDQQANPPGDPHHEEAPTQTFMGKIVKDGSKYSLRVGSKTYQLVGQGGFQKYEDRTVRVIGILELSSNTIQVESIDLVS
jgi:hypothetical protein